MPEPLAYQVHCDGICHDITVIMESVAGHIHAKITDAEIWSEWRLTVIAATVRIALVDILDLSEVDIPAGVFLHPAVGWS